MIELTPEQVKALQAQTEPMQVQNPCTREIFVLVPKAAFEQMQRWAAPLARAWDDPAMDVYNDPPS